MGRIIRVPLIRVVFFYFFKIYGDNFPDFRANGIAMD